jgi:hypothetical protein
VNLPADQTAPRFFHRTLPNGRIEISMRLGDFVSLVEAEKAANETMRDLAELQSWKQLESELTHGMDLATIH